MSISIDNNSVTDFLLSLPTFFKGAAGAFDFWGRFPNYSINASDDNADYNALLSDWVAVGNDLRKSIEEFKVLHEKNGHSYE